MGKKQNHDLTLEQQNKDAKGKFWVKAQGFSLFVRFFLC